MKTQTLIPSVSAKLKRSVTPQQCNGQTVYIYKDLENGRVLVSLSPKFETIFDVLKEDIKPVRKSGLIVSKPKVLTVEDKAVKDDLNSFYRDMGALVPFNCESCGKPLYAFNAWGKRCVSAHILPKGLFDSIKTNPHNIIFLGSDLMGGCGCHDIYDASVEKRIAMPVYNLVLERFTLYLRYELNDTDLISACDYLGISNWKDYV